MEARIKTAKLIMRKKQACRLSIAVRPVLELVKLTAWAVRPW